MSKLGTLIHVDGRPTLRFERHLPTPVDRVWRAVTDPDEMAAWFPSRVEGDRIEGAALRFPFEGDEAPTFDGTVVTWDPPRVFAFTWNGEVLRIELTPTTDGTTLEFTHQIHDRTEAARTGTGWHACLDSLAVHLGGSAGETSEDWWPAMFGEYLERMGPPLARRDGNTLVFDRVHHVAPDELRRAIDAWGDTDGATITIEPTPFGSAYEVRTSAADPEGAARWHAALVELDMYAASGQRMDVDDARFVEEYRPLFH